MVGWSSRPDSVWGRLAGQTLTLDGVSREENVLVPT